MNLLHFAKIEVTSGRATINARDWTCFFVSSSVALRRFRSVVPDTAVKTKGNEKATITQKSRGTPRVCLPSVNFCSSFFLCMPACLTIMLLFVEKAHLTEHGTKLCILKAPKKGLVKHTYDGFAKGIHEQTARVSSRLCKVCMPLLAIRPSSPFTAGKVE